MFYTSNTIYVVELRKSIRGVVLAGWRPVNGPKRTDVKFVPYGLATYLQLMPERNGQCFTRLLYDFSRKELDDLEAFGIIKKVTRKRGSVFVTVDLRKL